MTTWEKHFLQTENATQASFGRFFGLFSRIIRSTDTLPFGRLWYGEPDAISNAIGFAKFYSRSHDAVIRVYD
jgi:hypothetical protein